MENIYYLTSAGLTDKMKEKFFDIIGKCPKNVKVLYIPTAGIETEWCTESRLQYVFMNSF